jgi:hypothetical protein
MHTLIKEENILRRIEHTSPKLKKTLQTSHATDLQRPSHAHRNARPPTTPMQRTLTQNSNHYSTTHPKKQKPRRSRKLSSPCRAESAPFNPRRNQTSLSSSTALPLHSPHPPHCCYPTTLHWIQQRINPQPRLKTPHGQPTTFCQSFGDTIRHPNSRRAPHMCSCTPLTNFWAQNFAINEQCDSASVIPTLAVRRLLRVNLHFLVRS